MRGRAILSMLVAVACVLPAVASADSGSISISDAGGGKLTATVSFSSTACSSGGLYCGWVASVVERHSSLPCQDTAGFLQEFLGASNDAGGKETTFAFTPFFPRITKLCVILNNPAGTNVVAEAAFTEPTGYGMQRSTAYNCSSFRNESRAEYYLELYPTDPSRLDADHDGIACEDNPCPCGAEPIPPEPEAPPPAPAAVEIPQPTPACRAAQRGRHNAQATYRSTVRRYIKARGPAAERLRRQLNRQRARRREAEHRATTACS